MNHKFSLVKKNWKIFKTFNNLEKNTTIRSKLLMGFGVVLFGMVIIGCISIYGYQLMGQSTSYLYNKSISGVSEAKGLQTEIINLENELTNLMLASTIADKKLSEQIKADSSTKIAASIEKIKASSQTNLCTFLV